MACQAYDRMQPLRDGTVAVGGAAINFLDLPVEETFFRMLKHREFDIAELSLSSYVLTALPPVLALAMAVLNPDYFSGLTSGAGVVMLAVGAVLLVIGWIWMRRLGRIDF